ncbi:MAG TPA: flagellin [Bryobacteraceae bacterium]|nr:flagellin [Bryobacteraceae bacterium]
MISFQTNIDSLVAQQNLNTNSMFQSTTIQQLTSGYRINSSGDDAAGLAVANQDAGTIAQVTQGVANGNDGTALLQTMDGGMSNISQILDRLQTLSTQSASSSFTGNRSTLNAEFQTDITELNRQAQAIGLNTGGTYAQSLNIYMGGGGGSNAAAVSADGQVSVNLSASAVDAQALGLSGMQVVGGTTDIGGGNAATSVAAILAPAANNATSAPGTSDFVFAGAGYSGANAAKVAVNLSGVTNIATLVTALNTAIQAAGNGSTPQATAFKNANIVASVSTDSQGGQELAFTSSTSAFQVQAGDQTANALLGNLSSGATGDTVGSTLTSGVNAAATGAAMANPTTVSLKIDGGGLSGPVTLNLLSASTTAGAAIADLENQVSNNTALKAAGISMTGSAGGALTFTNSNGSSFNVQVTGDTANALGLGSFVAGASSAPDYSAITAGTAYNPATNPATAAAGSQVLGFSLNGGSASGANQATVNLLNGGTGGATGASTVGTLAAPAVAVATGTNDTLTINGNSITLAAGASLADVAAQIDLTANAALDTNATINAAGNLVLTSTTLGTTSAMVVTGDAKANLGLAGSVVAGTSATEANVLNQLNQQFGASATLQAAGLQAVNNAGSIEITSNNGTNFRLSTAGSTGSAGFGTSTAPAFAAGLTAAASDNMAVLDAKGTSTTGGISFQAMSYGNDTQSLTISANSNGGALQTQTITLANNGANRSGTSIDDAVTAINAQLQSSNNATLQQIVAVKDISANGTQSINFVSNLSSFSVGVGSSVNGNGLNAGLAKTEASSANGSAATASIDTVAGALAAVTAVTTAVANLGTAQAAVGIGENLVNYAVNLAQSQITNISAAESQIRDANVAAEAANLTKSQVLVQATVAAMAQANQEPQAILKLLQG